MLLIDKPLSFGGPDCKSGALTVVQLSSVPYKIKLPKIAVKVFTADVVIDSHDTALHDGKRTFRRVGMNIPANIFSGAVADAFMAARQKA